MQTMRRVWGRVGGGALLGLVVFGLGLGSGCGSGPKAGAAADAAAETFGRSCQDIRACIASGCGDGEQPCIDQCVQMGTTAAKAAFQTLTVCTNAQCSGGVSSCPCEQQCYAEGLCLTETEACVDAPTDLVCDEFCH